MPIQGRLRIQDPDRPAGRPDPGQQPAHRRLQPLARGCAQRQKKWLRRHLHRSLPHAGGRYRQTCERTDSPGLGQCAQPCAPVLLLGVFGGYGQGHRWPGAGWPRSGSQSSRARQRHTGGRPAQNAGTPCRRAGRVCVQQAGAGPLAADGAREVARQNPVARLTP